MKDISIRKAKKEDLPIIQKLSNILGEQSYGFDNQLSRNWAHTQEGNTYYHTRISGEKGICYVAEKNHKIVGFVSGTIHSPDDWRLVKRLEIDNLFIEESFRGKGIGKLLVDMMKQWGKEIGAHRIIVNAFADNTKALSFYGREGFIPYEITLQHTL